MTEYVKLINENEIQFPPKNKDGIINYNLNIEQLISDGYKEFIKTEKPVTNRFYHIGYQENTNNVTEVIIYDETQEEANARELNQAKQSKISENDTVRNEALNQGVTYKNVLFDSDTDQKINLLATVSMMGELDTVEWYGMDNQPLECTKEDLINIGGLITQLHTFCWTKNAEIKEQIAEATTIKDVEDIEIDYSLQGE